MSANKVFSGLLLCFVCISAQAHQIWIEPTGKTYSLHFGEYDENLKEVSPGLLDKLPQPVVVSVVAGEEKPLVAIKSKDGFSLDAKTGKAEALVVEVRNYPVFERKSGEQVTRSKWVPAARHISSFAVQVPRNMLDVVPNGGPGKFKLFFRAQPLAKAKLTLVAPNGWQKQLQSNEQGEFEVHTLWQGIYLIEIAHKEMVAGEIDGEKYDSASFTSTVSFTQLTGPATVRPEPAKPNQMK